MATSPLVVVYMAKHQLNLKKWILLTPSLYLKKKDGCG